MRRRIFDGVAIVSLVMLAISVAAVFSSFSLTRNTIDSTATTPVHRSTTYKLYRGQVEIFQMGIPLVVGSMPALGDRFQFFWFGVVPPGMKAIIGFHSESLTLFGPAGGTAHYTAFPVWILSLPFLIAPIRWIRAWSRERRSRRMDASTAFPVKIS